MSKITTETQIQREAILKAYRSNVRLKYSILADGEVSRNLPALEARIDEALAAGNGFQLTAGDIFKEVLDAEDHSA